MISECISIVSGGMDSVILTHLLSKYFKVTVTLLWYDYGQKSVVQEQEQVSILANELSLELLSVKVPLPFSSTLTDLPLDVAQNYRPGPAIDIVPARNSIFLSYALGICHVRGIGAMSIGAHVGDQLMPTYPDARPAFMKAFQIASRIATPQGLVAPKIIYFGTDEADAMLSKAMVINLANKYKIDFSRTWSCYDGGEKPCGICENCVER